MKTTNVVQAAVGNVGVSDEALEMSIDESSSVLLMDALGKLYSQPARAALREYLANGIDAHVEAGGTLPPIEIRLPDQHNRTLTIRDFGNGMSEEDFDKILRRYGASTKRHSNKLTGGFGLGAKAGFALSDEFHMTSFQSGVRIKVRIFKNAEGKGFIEVIERTATTEEDGLLVEVKVPAGNLEELTYNSLVADHFFAAYRDSEIAVTGSETYRTGGYYSDTKTRSKKIEIEGVSLHNPERYEVLEYGGAVIGWVGKKSGNRNQPIRAVIGRVGYAIKHDSAESAYRTYSYSALTSYSEKFGPAMEELNKFNREIVLNLPIGSVDLPSSREEITYSERTLKTLAAISTSVHRMVGENVQRVVNAKENGYEALCEIVALHGDGFWAADTVTWRGQAAPIDAKATKFTTSAGIVRYQKTDEARHSLSVYTVTNCTPSDVVSWSQKSSEKLMIVAQDNDEYETAVKKIKSNISDYHKAKDAARVEVFLFPDVEPLAHWFQRGKTLTLDEFLAVPKAYRKEKRDEAKALAAAAAGNPAFATPAKPTTASSREVFHMSLSGTVNGHQNLTVEGTPEGNLLANAQKFYYLSKAEVKELSSELSNLFPTKQSNGYGYIDGAYARILNTLGTVLGKDAHLVFVPATRNMEEFTGLYPHVPSVVAAVKSKLQTEWNTLTTHGNTDTFLSELFWLASSRNKVALINNFFNELAAGERTSMNKDLQEINLYMGNTTRVANGRLPILASELLGKDFVTQVTNWMETKIDVVGKRYPLLTMMNPVASRWDGAIKDEMIRYLKTC